MERIETTNPAAGICHMQVCAEADVTDEEVLLHCNRDNPSGTQNGWTFVVRTGKGEPVTCAERPDRLHLMVGC
jgi:hypothetical protein